MVITYFFSPSTKGFYRSDIHAPNVIPEDARTLSESAYNELMVGHWSEGQVIDWTAHAPSLKVPEGPTTVEMADYVRQERDTRLQETDFYTVLDYPITSENLNLVKEYRQKLRDITLQPGFPFDVVWPTLVLG